ncbi:GNAT family N-acetyltransferase [Agarilytica rhodophyticola]|uniref:GNAT family N-acetyltransferase n=1 Tax=Agarilytica rhodophyticola TaxID=1737490 RepID=UPI000B342A0D|nr:GNAT family N-acetyltransferase [Agarilytica rhodophyticola]
MNVHGEITIREASWIADQHDIIAIRDSVFIKEQGVDPEIEMDGLDTLSSTQHFLVFVEQQAIATARMLETGKIGRISVMAGYRGRGIATALLRYILRHCLQNTPLDNVYLHAQIGALPLYTKCGFNSEGEVFTEADIEHIKMNMALSTQDSLAHIYRDSVIRLENAKGFARHIELITRAATRHVDILSHHLSTQLYTPEFVSALSYFARTSRQSAIRILLHDSKPLASSSAPIVSLAQRLPSSIKIKVLNEQPQKANQGYTIADSKQIVFFNNETQMQGFANYRAKLEAEHQLEEFEHLWQHYSEEDPNLSLLTL